MSNVLRSYSEIFKPPGAKGFATAGFVARLPFAMATIGIVTMLSQTHGSYALAGAVAATFALANALISPQVSRLVDRLGQARVLTPATTLSVLAFLLLMAAARLGWPNWMLFVFALLAAAMPSFPAMVRARWTHLFRNRPELHAAFAFESIADELVYIAGASVSVGLAVALFPEAGVLASTLLLALGAAAFIAQRSTEPPPAEAGQSPTTFAIGLRSVQILALAMICIGAIFATAEVSAVAITKALGQPQAASLVIGVYAVGSFVVGVIFGTMKFAMPLQRQLAIAIAIVALTTVPLLFVGTVPLLALAIFVSGLAFSPTLILAFGLVARTVPPSMLTEGITWVMTGIGIGMALGSAASGWVIDAFGPHNGFWVSVVASLSALATVLLGQWALGHEDAGEQPVGRNEVEAACQPAS